MNPAEAFATLTALIAGWWFGWFSVARWLVRVRHKSRFVARVVGCASGFVSGVSAFMMATFVFGPKDVPGDPGPFLVFAPFVYAWWASRSLPAQAPAAVVPAPAANAAPAQDSVVPSPLRAALVGLDAQAAEQLQQLCEREGFEATTWSHPMAVLAIVPDGAAREGRRSYPDVCVSKAPAALQLVRKLVTENPQTASLSNLRVAVEFAQDQAGPASSALPSPPAAAPPVKRVSILDAAESDADKKRRTQTKAPTQSATLPCTFTFSYRDQQGVYGLRTVNVARVSSNGGHAYLEGFCHDRMADRTFRTDRIRGDLTDAETGELISVKRLLASVRTRASMDYRPPTPAPRSRTAREWQTAVFFAGFRGGKLDELQGLADAADWQVRGAISPTVDYVVCNGSAGKKQLEQADDLGISVIDEDTFRLLL